MPLVKRSGARKTLKRGHTISAKYLREPEETPRGNHVYESLREAIRERVLKPGHRLVERDVAVSLRVSRTPVREAFQLLEAHGIASTVTGKGLVITDLSLEEVRELYTMWEDLEGIAARHAAQHATDFDIQTLKRIAECWDPKERPASLLRLNRQFHWAIYRAAHNRYLMRALRAIDDSLALLGATTYTIPGRPAEVGNEHSAILSAIVRRDQDAAEKTARKHIHRAGELRMTMMTVSPRFLDRQPSGRFRSSRRAPRLSRVFRDGGRNP